ncbi:MAG TPA: DNA recombination protein RmuC [Solirubrobacteraceae bacterium]|nr:DNA recombination protein RmuC [Solirubrobacteraceae bacterium]
MNLALLILGLALGAVGAVAFGRRGAGARAQERQREERERMRDELKAISVDVLAQAGESLTQRMTEARRAEEERNSGEMARRAEEIKGLVAPVHEKLGKVESELARLERERRDSQVQLSEMVRALSAGTDTLRRETGELVSALKRPETRGSWGEIQLRRVVELAGMVAYCDFVEQSTIAADEGRLRPDLLVRLPGEKVIVVDSKVPLDAYLAAVESGSRQEHGGPQEREQRQLNMNRHARQTREHIAKLASKGYQRQFESTPELVVMFVPSDGIYQAALAEDPALIEYGVQQQVLMATPTTLIGLLRAVHYGWSQERIAESAREIAASARELHRRLGPFAEHLAKTGRQLDSAVNAYNKAVGSFEHKLIPQIRAIEQAGIASERQVEPPAEIETAARLPLPRAA